MIRVKHAQWKGKKAQPDYEHSNRYYAWARRLNSSNSLYSMACVMSMASMGGLLVMLTCPSASFEGGKITCTVLGQGVQAKGVKVVG